MRNISTLQLKTLTEFLESVTNEPEWVIENLLIKSGFSILVGSPKEGKSTLARAIIKSVLTGTSFLDLNVNSGPVIYIALEEIETQLKKSFEIMNLSNCKELYIHCGPLDWRERSTLESKIAKLKPSLVVIDTLGRFVNLPDFNDYSLVNEELAKLSYIAREYNCHIMCLHHKNKSEGSFGNQILGSNAIFGAVDNAIFISRKKNEAELNTSPRYGNTISDLIFTYENGSPIVLEKTPEGAINRIKKDILQLLNDLDDGITEQNLIIKIGSKTERTKKALRELVNEGHVIRNGNGRKGNSYTYGINSSPPI